MLDEAPRRRVPGLWMLLILAAGLSSPAFGQITIHHTPPGCYPRERFLSVRASVVPEAENVTARLFFREESETDFYFVDMIRDRTQFRAALPRPLPTTHRLVYFIEAVVPDYEVARTPEHPLGVVGSLDLCRFIDPATSVEDATPAIVVRALSDGATLVPPGFEPEGIVRLTVGSPYQNNGNNKAIIAALGAAGIAGATVGLLAGNSSDGAEVTVPATPASSPTPAPSPQPTPGTGGTTPPPSAAPVIACFDAPPTASAGQTLRLDASCSSPRDELTYEWSLGDGRHKEGRVVSPMYPTPGNYTIELRVKRGSSGVLVDRDQVTRTIDVLSPSLPGGSPSIPEVGGGAGADLAVEIVGILTPRIFYPYGVTWVITVTNYGPFDASGVTLLDTISADSAITGMSGALCSRSGTVSCTLGSMPARSSKTVTIDTLVSAPIGASVANRASVTGAVADPNPANNSAESRVDIFFGQRAEPGSASTVVFTSALLEFPAGVTGSVVVNRSAVDTVGMGSPFGHRIVAPGGANVVEAFLNVPSEAEGLWQFDFSGTDRFVRGSIEVVRGRVVTLSPALVVVRTGGDSGERIELRFQLRIDE